MTLPEETVKKLNKLSVDNVNIVIQVIDQLSESPIDTFRRLRQSGLENPMTDEEIDDFVSSARRVAML